MGIDWERVREKRREIRNVKHVESKIRADDVCCCSSGISSTLLIERRVEEKEGNSVHK